MENVLLSDSLKGRLSKDKILKSSRVIDNILEIKQTLDRLYIKVSINNSFTLRDRYIYDEIHLNNKIHVLKTPLSFQFNSYSKDLNLKFESYTIFIDANTFWSALGYEQF